MSNKNDLEYILKAIFLLIALLLILIIGRIPFGIFLASCGFLIGLGIGHLFKKIGVL